MDIIEETWEDTKEPFIKKIIRERLTNRCVECGEPVLREHQYYKFSYSKLKIHHDCFHLIFKY